MTLDQFGLVFHHVGLAVPDTGPTLKVLCGLGYRCSDEIYDPLQEVRLVWCTHDRMPAMELVAPTGKPGPVDNILKQGGESIYHVCYEAQNIDASVAAIRESGIRVLPVVPPRPAVLFGGQRVGFYQLRGFGLIEIVEES